MKTTHQPRNKNVVMGKVPNARRIGHHHQRPVKFASGKWYDRKEGKRVTHD